MEFTRLATKLIIFVMVIIVWAVYLEENADESYLIATGVMGAATIGKLEVPHKRASQTYLTNVTHKQCQDSTRA